MRLTCLLIGLLMAAPAQAADLKLGAGARLGGVIPLGALGPAVQPQVEFTGVLPVAQGRLRPVLTVGWSRLPAEGAGEDVRVGDGAYTWTLQQTALPVALGLTVRPLDPDTRVQPEITVAPQLVWLSTVSDGESGGAAFGVTRERYLTAGVGVSAGAAMEAGPGELVGVVAFTSTPLKGTLTGQGALNALAPSVGYRYWF